VNIRHILAKNLRDCRIKSELTQETLAWKAKLSPDFIGRIERAERTISVDHLARIAKVLNIEPYQLLAPDAES
jgi:transcriptional regulator with XRE-family HTH domain